jgi:hypothetical protein
MRYALWLSIAAVVTGLAVGALVMTFADTGLGVAGRLIRCLTGFFVSIVWIMAIADEVVSVLQVGSSFDHFCLLSFPSDVRFHFWTLRCHHRSYHLCCWQLSC